MTEDIPLFRQYYSKETIVKIKTDIESCLNDSILMFGPRTEDLEKKFAGLIGVKHAISVNSCTTALTICLSYFEIQSRQILVPSASFITSVSSIEFAGGHPVLVDTKSDSLDLNIDDLEKKITPETKGVLWVHLLGHINKEYDRLKNICRKHGLFLLEDAAHALGSEINNMPAGCLGDAACFSFYPTKILSCGSGGMITTNNDDLADYAKQKRLFGWNHEKGLVDTYGNDWFLDEIRCSILLNHMNDLEYILANRKKLADYYTKYLKDCRRIKILMCDDSVKPSHYQYAVLLNPDIDRDHVIKVFKSKYKIAVKGIYRPCHEEPVFSHLINKDLHHTENVLNKSLCLPFYCGLTQNQQDRVISAILSEIENPS
ncbi:MAG: DegT/DnrJ/EryC1/StrS family aminotransferase [Desulfobacula sp.]|nr:DegT/DnrJ/EryC1/StrS family aminotransferase [Desulfobacula sp.]MBU3915829.1 DegT/DnrJ/EryC1/StrS family aminotransferase [bacterium]